MKRQCFLYKSSLDNKRHVYVDVEISEELTAFLEAEANRKKFNYIVARILDQANMYSDVYGKEDINDQCKDVTAIKMHKGGNNARIYCKQVSSSHGMLCIIAAKLLLKKKVQQNDKSINQIIQTVASYEYEIS